MRSADNLQTFKLSVDNLHMFSLGFARYADNLQSPKLSVNNVHIFPSVL